jgi:hypothetical protein
MKLQDRYSWQATLADGTIMDSGEDLKEAQMVSLIPNQPLFPRHDLAGVHFVRRFCRGFLRGMGGGLKEYVHCIVCNQFRFYVRSSNGAVLITPPDYELYL